MDLLLQRHCLKGLQLCRNLHLRQALGQERVDSALVGVLLKVVDHLLGPGLVRGVELHALLVPSVALGPLQKWAAHASDDRKVAVSGAELHNRVVEAGEGHLMDPSRDPRALILATLEADHHSCVVLKLLLGLRQVQPRTLLLQVQPLKHLFIRQSRLRGLLQNGYTVTGSGRRENGHRHLCQDERRHQCGEARHPEACGERG
mmetsp:Transcript_1264/g.3410  ORF Transcript_1264/g.3410 Transcript_1264/m.3410 type:complete len:203 (-) Transcript_1264:45-653(-)